MINELYTAIYNHYLANPDHQFVKYIGERFYANEAPAGTRYPCAVYYYITGIDMGILDGDSDMVELQINCYASDLTEINDISSSCKKFFNRATIRGEECEFQILYNLMVGGMRQDDASPFQSSLTFQTLI